MQRCLQEKATNISWWQSGQRTRAKPSCRSPHFRKAFNGDKCLSLDEFKAGQKSPVKPAKKAAGKTFQPKQVESAVKE